MMSISNIFCTVNISNYRAMKLQDTLDNYSKAGYQLVSTEMAKNQRGEAVMYLFFTKVKND